MTSSSEEVDQLIDKLEHRRKPEIIALRQVILSARADAVEEIKWNAPSYAYGGEHRITMRLRPGDKLQLIFHRGVSKRAVVDLTSVDKTGKLGWAAPDRGVLDFGQDDPLLCDATALKRLVVDWVDAAMAAD